MPLVKVELRKGKSADYKKAILDGIHQALVDCFNVPPDNRLQRLYELEPADFELSDGKTDAFVLIELTVIKGRSYEAKKKLYQAIVDNLEKAPGITRTDTLIVLNEVPAENWGIRGGIPARETELGLKARD